MRGVYQTVGVCYRQEARLLDHLRVRYETIKLVTISCKNTNIASVHTYFNKSCFRIWSLKHRIQYNAMLCFA